MTHIILSLRGKLALLMTSVALAALVTASAMLAVFDWQRMRESDQRDLDVQCRVLADQLSAALSLDDRQAARESLDALASDPQVRSAWLYDHRGRLFASYQTTAASPVWLKPPPSTARDEIASYSRVTAGGDVVGILYLIEAEEPFSRFLSAYTRVLAGVVFGCAVLAMLLSWRVQSVISAPILAIAGTADAVTASRDFTRRVEFARRRDEVGVLARAFNAMLDEIQRRDADLARHRTSLEEQVETRTAELLSLNQELVHSKNEAEQASLAKSAFLANMSHEIRTPMNGVLGAIQLVLDSPLTDDQRESLSMASQAGEGLLRLLNDILDLSRLEAGKMTVESVPFALKPVLQETVAALALAAQHKQIGLGFRIEPGTPPVVVGDPLRLRQILLNLAGNAVKFTQNGEVGISAGPAGGDLLRFQVTDTGIGIPDAMQEAIFKAFTQADGSHSRRFGGSGLGLAITTTLVGLMRGAMRVDSRIGEGSVFTVDLMLPAGEAASEPRIESGAVHLAGLEGACVLVAEDNLINQKVVSKMLVRMGCRVTLATSGGEALDLFRAHRFDAILMDIQMPGTDGLEAARSIRAEEPPQGPRIPIIALTAHALSGDRERCLDAGMNDYATKPVSMTELHARLQRYIRR